MNDVARPEPQDHVFPGERQLRLFDGRISLKIPVRPMAISTVLLLSALLVAFADLSMGAYSIPVPQIWKALAGDATDRVRMVVIEWRLPRIAAALLFGAALGVSGAVFQSLTRNPLGSPDIVGFDAGAFAGVLLVMVFVGTSPYEVMAGALGGGILTAGAVYLIAQGTTGLRFVLVGIGIGVMLSAINTWMLTVTRLEIAMSAAFWGAGSLDGMDMERLLPVAAMLAAFLAGMAGLHRSIRQLELGDDVALSLGVPVRAVRIAMLVIAGALTAIVTAAAGPIGFVALSAPQLARRLAGTPGIPLAASAAMGALLLSASDLVATHLFAPTKLPVGLVTVSGGGAYLVWLLLREASRSRKLSA
ncbi:FecCD family ABC transporter permease [Rhizobium puerariae]|uniref:FecCD family ABC transporter permease n=1 Tax=Rhizobium puerariae TaxID=1585791 RepID=A0ABV6AGR3_9HYPH